jgi:hypothetical protein
MCPSLCLSCHPIAEFYLKHGPSGLQPTQVCIRVTSVHHTLPMDGLLVSSRFTCCYYPYILCAKSLGYVYRIYMLFLGCLCVGSHDPLQTLPTDGLLVSSRFTHCYYPYILCAKSLGSVYRTDMLYLGCLCVGSHGSVETLPTDGLFVSSHSEH